MAHDVFISHSSKDKAIADATCACIEGNGIRCWIAPRDIRPGAEWGESIIKAIRAARVMVVIFSSHANASKQIMREVERAVNAGVTLIPMRIEEILPEGNLDYFLSAAHWLDAFTPPLDHHLDQLAKAIQEILKLSAPPIALGEATATTFDAEPSVVEKPEPPPQKSAPEPTAQAPQPEPVWTTPPESEPQPTSTSPTAYSVPVPAPEPKKGSRAKWVVLVALLILTLVTAIVWVSSGTPVDKLPFGELSLRALSGDAEAEAELGHRYENGLGVPKDIAAAVKWYGKAGDQGDHTAVVSFQRLFAQEQADEFSSTMAVANRGDAVAEFNIGCYYESGTGVKQDYAQAWTWFNKAADQGYDEAKVAIGSMYEHGFGVNKDIPTAIEWYRKAAADNANARAALERLGYSVTTDSSTNTPPVALPITQATGTATLPAAASTKDTPLDELQRRADAGQVAAETELADRYQNGRGGVLQDHERASSFYYTAAKSASQVQDGDGNYSTLAGIINQWASSDPAGAATWLARQPTGRMRDIAVKVFIDQITSTDPSAADQWAESITDPATRLAEVTSVLQNWLKTDHAAASIAVQKSSLPAAVKNQLLPGAQP